MDDLEQREDRAPESRGDGTRDEVAELKKQLDEQQDKMLRALAEADNVRRRLEKSAEDRVRYANESLIRDLIPVIDNFDRALAAVLRGNDANVASLVQGVELIQRELLRVLERAGVVRYSAMGERFDPTRHEAVSRIVSESAAPNTVVAETAP